MDTCQYETDPGLDPAVTVALLNTHATLHIEAANVGEISGPSISFDSTSGHWAYFISRRENYAKTTRLTGEDRTAQLLECCEEDLRQTLTNSCGSSLATSPDVEILAAMKQLAVRTECTMVTRVGLHNME